jgi:hypothetical protein
MRSLAEEPEVVAMANALRLGPGDPVENIIAHCHRRISQWRGRTNKVKSIDDLENLVCKHLHLVFEEFYDDDGLKRIVQKYVGLGETIFATLPGLFDENTFATLVERRKVDGRSRDRYVAVIDCRGDKAHRRFFTRWHEIAHLLTLYNQLELPLHRSTSNKTPTERLMDVIAGKVGFFDEILQPMINSELAIHGRLTFEGVERIRMRFSPTASFQATLNACAARVEAPAAILEIGWGLKKSEEQAVNSLQLALIELKPPTPKVRVLSFVPNNHCLGMIEIHRNMEVPADSILFRLLNDPNEFGDKSAIEELGEWEHSSGKHLPPARVVIEARNVRDRVIALLQLSDE